jgi:hypothetical protein
MYKNRWVLAAAIGVLAWSLMSPEAEARRQYNPGLKRFMQRDPLAFETQDERAFRDGLNLYGYALSMPLSKSDPTGKGHGSGGTIGDCSNVDIDWIPEGEGKPGIDGAVVNGRMIKLADGCTLTILCDGSASARVACHCTLLGTAMGGCRLCEPGRTICEMKCVAWKTQWIRVPGDLCPTETSRRVCTRRQCLPDAPFDQHGGTCKTHEDGTCDGSGCPRNSIGSELIPL